MIRNDAARKCSWEEAGVACLWCAIAWKAMVTGGVQTWEGYPHCTTTQKTQIATKTEIQAERWALFSIAHT